MVPDPETPQIESSTPAAQEGPKFRVRPMTPEEILAHGEMVTEALKQGLRENGVK